MIIFNDNLRCVPSGELRYRYRDVNLCRLSIQMFDNPYNMWSDLDKRVKEETEPVKITCKKRSS